MLHLCSVCVRISFKTDMKQMMVQQSKALLELRPALSRGFCILFCSRRTGGQEYIVQNSSDMKLMMVQQGAFGAAPGFV